MEQELPRASENGIFFNVEHPLVPGRKLLRPEKKGRLRQLGSLVPERVEVSRDVGLLLRKHHPRWKALIANVQLCMSIDHEVKIEQRTTCAQTDGGDPSEGAGRGIKCHHCSSSTHNQARGMLLLAR